MWWFLIMIGLTRGARRDTVLIVYTNCRDCLLRCGLRVIGICGPFLLLVMDCHLYFWDAEGRVVWVVFMLYLYNLYLNANKASLSFTSGL